MATAPRVSVIIPCYRGERFIADAIQSVFAQADDRVEIVVVDDGSPDRAAELVRSMGDERIRLVRHDENRGIAAARNTGFAASRGEYVTFLDQDDLWLPGVLDAWLGLLEVDVTPRIALAFCDIRERGESGREWDHRPTAPSGIGRFETRQLLAALLRHRFLVLGAALIRRTALDGAGPFDVSIRGGSDDFDMLVRLAEQGAFARVPRPLFVHRRHGHNYSSADMMIAESLAVMDRVVARHPALEGAARSGRARKLYVRAASALLAGRVDRARADFQAAFAQSPWQPRIWAGLVLCASGPLRATAIAAWRRRQEKRG